MTPSPEARFGFGEQFHQLWRYYLMYCEGAFAAARSTSRR